MCASVREVIDKGLQLYRGEDMKGLTPELRADWVIKQFCQVIVCVGMITWCDETERILTVAVEGNGVRILVESQALITRFFSPSQLVCSLNV